MAYGARLESVLGASPRGFESPILRRCLAPEPLIVAVPGLSCVNTLCQHRALCGRQPGTRWSPGVFFCGRASTAHVERRRGGSRSRYLVGGPGWSGGGVCTVLGDRVPWAAAVSPRALRLPVVVRDRVPWGRRCPPGWSAHSGERVHWSPVLRVTVSSEPPQGRNAARIRVRCRVRGGSSYSRTGTPLRCPCPSECFPRSPPRRASFRRPRPPRGSASGAVSSVCAAECHGPRPAPLTVPVRSARARGALRRPSRR